MNEPLWLNGFAIAYSATRTMLPAVFRGDVTGVYHVRVHL